jgi:hypothetical protein
METADKKEEASGEAACREGWLQQELCLQLKYAGRAKGCQASILRFEGEDQWPRFGQSGALDVALKDLKGWHPSQFQMRASTAMTEGRNLWIFLICILV